jgi:uncharacterized protein YkwD
MRNRRKTVERRRRTAGGTVARVIAVVVTVLVAAPLILIVHVRLLPSSTGPGGVLATSTAVPPSGGPTATCAVGDPCGRPDDLSPGPLISAEARLLDLVNDARRRAGCAVLRIDIRLATTARAHAEDMITRGFAAQRNPDKEDPEFRARRAGYQGKVAESFAAGLPSAEEVLAQWTNPRNAKAVPVRERITDCRWVSAGVGYAGGRVLPEFGDGAWVLTLGDA